MALSPTSPSADISGANPAGPASPFSRWRMRPDWGHRSPVSRRQHHHPLSPLKLRSDMPESPCRPATLSPCTPPPEAPCSAKSPMLVLQKRVDLAMDEIQELRALVESLHGELQSKNRQIELAIQARGLASRHLDEQCPPQQVAQETMLSEWVAVGFDHAASFLRCLPLLLSLDSETRSLSLIWFTFLVLSTALQHDLCETLLCLFAAFGNSAVLDLCTNR